MRLFGILKIKSGQFSCWLCCQVILLRILVLISKEDAILSRLEQMNICVTSSSVNSHPHEALGKYVMKKIAAVGRSLALKLY